MISLPKVFVSLLFASVLLLSVKMPSEVQIIKASAGIDMVYTESVAYQSEAFAPIENVDADVQIVEVEYKPRVAKPVSLNVKTNYDETIEAAAYKYGADANWMKRVMMCESGGYVLAKNPNSTASGLFQFLTSTWKTTPYGNESIWDADAQINAAAWMYSQGRSREWMCK